MWQDTKATRILGIDYPILQGPFGGNFSTVELLAAVSNSGGLGAFGAYTLSAEEIVAVDRSIRAATNKPYNINLWISDNDAAGVTISDADYDHIKNLYGSYFEELKIPFPQKPAPFQSRYENQIDALLELQPPVFSFMFGVPSTDVMDQCRKRNIKMIGAATTIDEGILLNNAGVDLVIASGFEAGGHRPSFLDASESSLTGTFVLVQQLREIIKTPVIAAGGIADGKAVAAALTLGASGVQIGTAFLACNESGATAAHREILFSEAGKYTSLTRLFTGRLGRGIAGKIPKDMSGKGKAFLPFPLQTQLLSSLRKAALDQQRWDLILFWSGQIAPLLKHTKATELMRSLIEETSAHFR